MKRTIILCLALMLWASACAAPLVARYEGDSEAMGFTLMLAEDGTALTPRDTYGNIYPVYRTDGAPSESFFMATESVPVYPPGFDPELQPMLFALMDDSGRPITGFEYTGFEYCPNGNILVFTDPDGFDGVMDEQGNVILEARYINLRPNGLGGYLGLDVPDRNFDYSLEYPIVYIDGKGRSFPTGYTAAPYSLGSFRSGFCRCTATGSDGCAGTVFLDFEGTNVFSGIYGYSEGFSGRYAPVYDPDTGLNGLIGEDGAFVLEPAYTSLDPAGNSRAYLAVTDAEALILDGETLETLGWIDFSRYGLEYAWFATEYFICAGSSDESFLFDLHGGLCLRTGGSADIWYSAADSRPERAVVTEGEWPRNFARLVDFDGNTYGPEFQSLMPVSWLDGQGRFTFCTFRLSGDSEADEYPDWTSYRYGLCDENGNILLEARYTFLEYLAPNRYWARLGPRCGMIDETGKWYYAIDDFEYLMD